MGSIWAVLVDVRHTLAAPTIPPRRASLLAPLVSWAVLFAMLGIFRGAMSGFVGFHIIVHSTPMTERIETALVQAEQIPSLREANARSKRLNDLQLSSKLGRNSNEGSRLNTHQQGFGSGKEDSAMFCDLPAVMPGRLYHHHLS